MSNEYRVFMEAIPPKNGCPELPAGWFGDVPGIYVNEYIYCRVTDKISARVLNKSDAVFLVQDMRRMGYEAKSDPPITVTY